MGDFLLLLGFAWMYACFIGIDERGERERERESKAKALLVCKGRYCEEIQRFLSCVAFLRFPNFCGDV